MKEEDLSTLNDTPDLDNRLKEYLVNYVGEARNPENDNVTMEMIIDVLSEEFPELVLCLSEENWVRGYKQALTDVEEGERMFQEAKNEKLHTEQK